MNMEAWDEEEEELDIARHFQVDVVVLEARHLFMINSDCKVEVAVGNQKKTMRSKTARTDAPYFNELCIFNFYKPLTLLLDDIVNVKIYGVPKLARNRLIGGFTVELSTVWVQPNHQFYHKWAALTDAKNPAGGVKGYLKCDIGIHAQGMTWTHVTLDPGDNIEDHLLVPYGDVNDRQRAKFIFSVFRADNFSDYVTSEPFKSLYAYVRITYAGKSGKTSVASRTYEPLWNEELAFDDMVPALCQYVHIELCDAFRTTGNGTLGTAKLDLRQLSHESEKGFLPTYGPSFLYLYNNFGKSDRQNKCPYINCSFTYSCRLLLALRTEVVDYAEDVLVKKPNLAIKPKKIPTLQEGTYFRYREFIFFAVVFDILLFDASIVTNKVSVRVNIGPETPIKDEHILRSTENISLLKKPQEDEKEEDTWSMRSKKTVTFEGDEVTDVGSEAPILEEVEKEASTPRGVVRRQPFLRTLMYWPSNWPEGKKWGKKMNERLQRRDETRFRKWKQEKSVLKSWLPEWKRKRKETTFGTPPKRTKFQKSSGFVQIRKPEEYTDSSWDEVYSSKRGGLEYSEDSEVTAIVKYDPSYVSSSSQSSILITQEEDIDLIRENKSYDSGDRLEVEEMEPVRVRRRSPNDGYWPLRTLTTWPKNCKGIRKGNSKLEPVINKLKTKRPAGHKRKIHSDTEASEEESERIGRKKHGGLNKLRTWPTAWRWERKRERLNDGEVGSAAGYTKQYARTLGPTQKTVKINLEDLESHEKSVKHTTEIGSRERRVRGEAFEKKYPREVIQEGQERLPNMSTGRREANVKAVAKEPEKPPREGISEKTAPSVLVPTMVVPPVVLQPEPGTTADETTTATSDNELPVAIDRETSSDLSLSYMSKARTISEESLWSEKTIWRKEIPPIEDEESSAPEKAEKEGKTFKKEEPKLSARSSEMSEEIARMNYSDYESRRVGDSGEIPKRRRKVTVVEDEGDEGEHGEVIEEELEEEEEEEEMEDLSEGHGESEEKKPKEEPGGEELKDDEAKEKILESENGIFVGKEKKLDDSSESEKTKKRHWYSNNTRKVFSPDNTTEANIQVFMALQHNKVKGVGEGNQQRGNQEGNDVAEDSKQSGKDKLATIEDEDGYEETEDMTISEFEEMTAEEERLLRDPDNIRHVRVFNGCNSTKPQPITVRQHYGYASFSGKYPCLHINGEWPNALRRMYRSNIIQQSVLHFTSGISAVVNELSSENKIEASEKLKQVFSEVSAECREILTLTAKIEPEDTNLYRERKKYYHREIGEIIANMETASKKKVLIAEDELNRAYGYLSTLKRYAQDPEDSIPDTEIWLIKDGKSVAQHRMHTRKVVFSPNVSERGVRSGKIQSVIVRGKDGEVAAKLEMFMWFGLGTHFFECRNMLPSGYSPDVHYCPGTVISDIPLLLTYTEVHYFKFRIHLFQARIMFGADTSGLADPFVRVTVLDQQKESKVEKETLNPSWNETLIFPKLTMYGPADHIKLNSMMVTIEVMDYDYLSKSELIGRSFLKPEVRLSSEEYKSPKLSWEVLRRGCSETGQILLAAELLEVSEDSPLEEKAAGKVFGIPMEIRPRYVGHRLEVLFWGVRELKKKAPRSTSVFVTLECGGKFLTSPVLKNAMKFPNFPGTVQTLRLNLPENHEYKPPLILKLFQTSSFALTHETYAGNCIVPSVKVFFCETLDDNERKRKEIAYRELLEESKRVKKEEEYEAEVEERERKRKLRWKRMKTKMMDLKEDILAAFVRCSKAIKCKLKKKCSTIEEDNLPLLEEDESLDWWVKYYASKEPERELRDVEKLVIYDDELEAQPEYHGFTDFIYTFNMVVGKVKNEVQSSILMGKVKAAIKLYRWPLDENHSQTLYGVDIRKGILRQLPKNEAIKYVVRVYIVACKNLTPKDLFGKSDPYVFLQVGNQKINDEKNYIPKQVNPIFGRCFEFRGVFPEEHLLRIKVMDHDMFGEDDLIGETTIDLESRYYTRHHASCGISESYATTGYAAWRDVFRPTEILKTACKQSNLPQPVYSETGVRVGKYEFRSETTNPKYRMEGHALAALKKWHEIPVRGFRIVPQHVETRSLYHPSFPGVEQGKIEMWVDIFPADFRYVPPIVNIKPREPIAMELRAIVWNVEDVVLDDTTLLFNEKMSDIYVQGWLNALEGDKQVTDVHYRSMNGEGNFNWRFVFPFKYVASERRLVVYKKVNAFDMEPEEMKFPCRLELQVWDNDFLSDDFLGSLNLELAAMPRGAKISTRCKLSMFEEATPKINLFKIRRTRGWWPFRRIVDAESSEYSLTGKIDLELEVVTEKEAKDYPVGKGREEPRALPEPKRPESSFIWALNPLKTFRYIICRKYGKYLVILILIAMLVAFIVIGIYAFPGYAVKRMVGA